MRAHARRGKLGRRPGRLELRRGAASAAGMATMAALLVGAGTRGEPPRRYLGTAGRDSTGAIERAGSVDVSEMRVGDCFEAGDDEEISEVNALQCSEPHTYQVFAVIEHETATYPSDTELETIFATICLSPYEEFVGTAYADSTLYATMFWPTEDSFADGDRGYVCVLNEDDLSPITGSMEGSHR